MKKKILIIVAFICITVIVLFGISYTKLNAMTVDVVDFDVEYLEDSTVIDDFCGDSEKYMKLFEESPNDFYLVTCRFNVNNTHSISYSNWKVVVKSLNNKYNIFYNQYRGEGAFFVINEKSSIENLGTCLLIYANDELVENVKKEFDSNVSIYAIGYPCF
ncbi:MAG: hypothetical protein ACI4GC_01825 [Acutalibacteraceae bacterium]